MTNQQGAPEALRLAKSILLMDTFNYYQRAELDKAAYELRTLHAENERLAALVEAQQPAPSAAAMGDVDLPDAEDMAHSAVQEALSFGLSHDVIYHWMRHIQDQTVKAMLAAPQPSPTPQADSQPAPDPADIIAGALQTSRGHAIELMQQAVDADRAARAPADSVTPPAGESRCANCGKSAADSHERIADYPEEGEWFCSAQCKDQHDELDCPHLTHNGYRHPAESERLIACERALRSLASWLSVGGFNAPTVDAKVFEEKIRWGIEHLLQATTPAHAADSVLEDAAPQSAIDNPYPSMSARHEAFEQGVLKTLAAFRAKHAARKQGANHD